MKEEGGRGAETRERLLQAAGEVFARRGFRTATVRDISRKAKANVAAVNYHFGDKQGLYAAVLEHTLSSALQKYPPDGGLKEDATPEARLYAFIRSFLFRLLGEGLPAWHGRLMAREIVEPTAALDQLVETVIRPLHERLLHIVSQLAGLPVEDERVRLCQMSILGQCLFYYYATPVISRLYSIKLNSAEIERFADHITNFSFAAIQQLSEPENPPRALHPHKAEKIDTGIEPDV